MTLVKRMSQPFSLAIDNRISGQGGGKGDVFGRSRGDRLIAGLLASAGLAKGAWTFRVLEPLPCSGATPPLQIRRPEAHGVIIHAKPGDNGTCVKGMLVVTPDKGDPQEIFEMLSQAVKSEKDRAAATKQEVNLLPELGAGPSAPLQDATPEPPATSDPSKPLNAADVLLQNREKIKMIAEIPGKLLAIRDQRDKIRSQIVTLEAALDKLAVAEAALMDMDFEALAMLVDSIK